MTTSSSRKKVDISTPDPKPVVTVLFIMAMLAFGMTNGRFDWVEKVCFTPEKYASFLNAGDYGGLITLMWNATSAQLSQWLWIPNGLCFWVFGYVVEKKLKGWRYPLFLLICMVASWTAVYATAGLLNYDRKYIGPSMITFALLGGYFAFFPKKAFKPQLWVRPSTEIFRNEKPPEIHERYWINPWIYVVAFSIYEIVLQIALQVGPDGIVKLTHLPIMKQAYLMFLGKIQLSPAPQAFSPIAAGISIAVGALVAQALPRLAMSIKPKRPGGKLQLEVLQHYRELRTLDMTHEQACEGAAKFAAVPIDIAKDWISKGAAGLRDQQLDQ